MQLTIQGQHIDLGNSLRTHVTDKIESVKDKYFNRAVDVHVTFSKDTGSVYKANITFRVGKEIFVQASAKEHDPYVAFDAACDRVAKQLRRYKRRLRDHHDRLEETPEGEMLKARSYVLSQEPEKAEAEEYIGDEPAVIAEMTTNIQTMSVSEAVMRLDLADQSALLFRNPKHGGLNLVYRRADGNIGWVDPQEAQESALPMKKAAR